MSQIGRVVVEMVCLRGFFDKSLGSISPTAIDLYSKLNKILRATFLWNIRKVLGVIGCHNCGLFCIFAESPETLQLQQCIYTYTKISYKILRQKLL